jgi:hypothetical protein
MMDALHSAIEHRGRRFAPEMGETSYTAHMKRTRIEV